MPLKPVTRDFLALVERETGHPVKLFEDPDLPTLAKVRMARGPVPAHFIRYKPAHDESLDYMEERALVARLPQAANGAGLLTVWQVTINAPGGQVHQHVIRLGLTLSGERSVLVQRQTREFLSLQPSGASGMDQRTTAQLINGTAGQMLHRQLVYSGALPEGASYTSRLVACVEIAS